MRSMPSIRRLLVSAVAAGLVLAVAAPTAGAATFKFFRSPSGKIACVWEKSGSRESLRCDVYDTTNPQPPRPSSCDAEYGSIFAMSARGRVRRLCVGDAAIGEPTRTLAVRHDPPLRSLHLHLAHVGDDLRQPRRPRLDALAGRSRRCADPQAGSGLQSHKSSLTYAAPSGAHRRLRATCHRS